jgi:hypothetical protein
LSRNSTIRAAGPTTASDTARDHHQMVQDVITLYGDQAPTAAAWCAFIAWCEESDEDYRFWSDIFQRLRN